MNRLSILILLILGLGACNEMPKANPTDRKTETSNETSSSTYETINLQYNNPTLLDSSDWVIYPLSISGLEGKKGGFKSSSYASSNAYWNVAFYNTETKQTRLLSESMKMIIHSISAIKSVYVKEPQPDDKRIYYIIRTKDYNQDGKLNYDDPRYLYVSELSGEGFKQISPDNSDLIHWETIDKTGKILLQVRRDSNKNNKFDDDDEIVSYLFDIHNDKMVHVFSEEFHLKTKKLFEQQWVEKK